MDDKQVRPVQDGDRVKLGDRSGVVQAVNGDAVMVLFEGEHQNEIVDRDRLTLFNDGEFEKQDGEPERGPDQTVSPGLVREEQRFPGTRGDDEAQ